MICKKCLDRGVIASADFGGKFNCAQCGKLQENVPSVGHGMICYDCQKKGYCKFCGEFVGPNERVKEE